MILAAYMVAGFLVASIYAVGMLRGRRDRLHRLGLLIPLTIACIATPIQLFVGDTAARAVADHQPAKFAGMECIQETGADQTEYVGGICTERRGQGGDRDPRPRLLPGRLQRRHRGHRPQRHPGRRTAARPTPCSTSPSTRWSGSASALLLLGALARLRSGGGGATSRATPWFLRAVAISGAGAILALWCGWIVTEVGRQPWIVQGYMRTAEAVTEAEGIWFAFAGVLLLYAALGHGRDPRPAGDVAALARGGRRRRRRDPPTAPAVEEATT